MDLSFLTSILEGAKKLAEIIPGTTDDRILDFATNITGALTDIVPIVRGTDQEAPVNETLDQLVARVEAHAERVSKKLRGD